MRYYKAYETDERPYLLFNLVADSLAELVALGLDSDPLVVAEDRLLNPSDPNYISYEFGICHKRIFNGELVAREAGEINAQELAVGKATQVQKTNKVSTSLDTTTFNYDGREFPMTPAARVVYAAVIESTPESRNLITTTGAYQLTLANLEAFKTAYYTALFAANDQEL